jgi:DNA anti-recombination protein RmuC
MYHLLRHSSDKIRQIFQVALALMVRWIIKSPRRLMPELSANRSISCWHSSTQMHGQPAQKSNYSFRLAAHMKSHKFNLMGTSSAKGQVEEQLKDEAQKQVEKAQTEIEEKVKDEGEKLLEEGDKQIEQQLDSAKKEVLRNLEDEAGDVLNEELDSAANNLKESLKDLFKRKKKN